MAATELCIRGWPLIHNLAPRNPTAVKKLIAIKAQKEVKPFLFQ
jgi:hypothetical protein